MKLTDVEKRVLDCIKTGVTFSGVAPEPYQICFRLKLPGSLLRPVLRAMELKGCIERDLNGKSTIRYVSSQPIERGTLLTSKIEEVLRTIYLRTEFIGVLADFKISVLGLQSNDRVLTKYLIAQYTKKIKVEKDKNKVSRRKLTNLISEHDQAKRVRLLG